MIAGNAPFDMHHHRYEKWFVEHRAAYCSELLAVRALLPYKGLGLEIGVGTGRFAAPLGVPIGIDPSEAMLKHARARGIDVVQAVAEKLPFATDSFDYGLIVTTICFVADTRAMLREARRVIRPEGRLVVGFIDRDSCMGQGYLARQSESVFYREASFYSAAEVGEMLKVCGFPELEWVQTLSTPLSGIREIEPCRPGHGTGAFVVVSGMGPRLAKLRDLSKTKEMFQRLTDSSAEWLYWRTPEGEMRYISPAGAEISGYSVTELARFPDSCEAIIHPDDRQLWFEHVHEADKGGTLKPIEFRIVTKKGEVRWVSHLCRPIYGSNGEFLGVSGSNRDVTERKQAEEQLRYLSNHDRLTGLYNREFFEAELAKLAGGGQFPVSIVMADVDGLKQVNDSHGHVAGDLLLQHAAQILKNTFREQDFVARIGGDEFAVLLPDADSRAVAKLLKRIETSQETSRCSETDCLVSLSLGAVTARDGESLMRGVKLADKRMYQRKSKKKHR